MINELFWGWGEAFLIALGGAIGTYVAEKKIRNYLEKDPGNLVKIKEEFFSRYQRRNEINYIGLYPRPEIEKQKDIIDEIKTTKRKVEKMKNRSIIKKKFYDKFLDNLETLEFLHTKLLDEYERVERGLEDALSVKSYPRL